MLRFDKDSCRRSLSVVDLTVQYSLVSSAYIADEPSDTASGRSLMKTTNNNGPKRLPCGTPETTGDELYGTPSRTTL